jgi:hypothetical protein
VRERGREREISNKRKEEIERKIMRKGDGERVENKSERRR